MIDEQEIAEIIARVRHRMGGVATAASPAAALRAADELASDTAFGPDDGIFPTVDAAVAAATEAFRDYQPMGLDRRYAIIDAVRRAALEHAERLAHLSHRETGMGRPEDKLVKIRLVATKAPGPEDLEPRAVTGDRGMMVTEWAPFGVIASITPTTNPTSTVINNTISVVSAGNAVVFNAHPKATRISAEAVRVLHRAIVGAGGPPGLVSGVARPTIETARALMNHAGVRVILVTGGPGVVREALNAGKRAVTAGPGNPPVVVDETADIDRAGRDIVAGASFDNNIVCIDEKEVLVVDGVADRLVQAMARNGAYVLRDHELRRVERLVFAEPPAPGKRGRIHAQWIGQNAGRILGEIGVQAGHDVRILVAEVPLDHGLVWTEQLLPVLPIVRIRDVDQAIDAAVRVEHGFRHTASIYSSNVQTITRMARAMNCSIFVANGPNYAGLGEGGEGFTSFSIASPSGDGMTRPRTFSRERRITVVGALRIV